MGMLTISKTGSLSHSDGHTNNHTDGHTAAALTITQTDNPIDGSWIIHKGSESFEEAC